ncbi:MAG: hypothetical protein ACRCZF_01480 [Gemmataceae bacterium]
MAKKREKAKPPVPQTPPAPKTAPWFGGMARAVVAILLLTLGIGAVVGLGQLLGPKVADDPRYAIPFSNIQCEAPPNTPREVFLSEVRALGGFSEHVATVEPKLLDSLPAAFRRHPWVEEVLSVDPLPKRALRVQLKFRQPILRVTVSGTGEERMVDSRGVLLPLGPVPETLAKLVHTFPTPQTPPGQVWDEPHVIRAAQIARDFDALLIERTDRDWRITLKNGKNLLMNP